MPTFVYRGLGPSGSTSGTIEAGDRKQAAQRLMSRQIKPLSLQEQSAKAKAKPRPKAAKKSASRENEESDSGQKAKASRFSLTSDSKLALVFLQRLLELLSSGLPLGDAVKLLSQRLRDPKLKEMSTALWKELSEGRTLADAMRQKPDVFPLSTTHLIEAGEATGNLVPVLDRLVSYMEESAELRAKVLGSMAYPGFICFVAMGVVMFFLYFLLPKIQGIIEKLGGEMQWVATALISTSEFAVQVMPFLIVGLVVCIIGVAQYRKTASGREVLDSLLLRIPFIGRIVMYKEIVQCSQLMSTLMENGINTTETLRLSEKALDNVQMRAQFTQSRLQIQEGMSIAGAFKENNFMPDIGTDILTVGENTGDLVNSLRNICKIHLRELEKAMGLMTTLISGGALAFAFVLVALIAVIILTAVMQVSNTIIAS